VRTVPCVGCDAGLVHDDIRRAAFRASRPPALVTLSGTEVERGGEFRTLVEVDYRITVGVGVVGVSNPPGGGEQSELGDCDAVAVRQGIRGRAGKCIERARRIGRICSLSPRRVRVSVRP
jgi:hypothetical protein